MGPAKLRAFSIEGLKPTESFSYYQSIISSSSIGPQYHVTFIDSSILSVEFQTLKSEIEEMKKEIRKLREKLSFIDIIEVRDLPDEEIEKLVMEYLDKHEKGYPSEIAEEYGLDPYQVLKVMERMEAEGKIEAVE